MFETYRNFFAKNHSTRAVTAGFPEGGRRLAEGGWHRWRAVVDTGCYRVAAMTRGLRAWTCLWTAAALLGAGRQARANGAFPDSLGILLRQTKPDQIILATNFGLVTTDDGGKTWLWSCEQAASFNGTLYQLGPAPAERIFAVGQFGLIFTDDDSCTWTISGGSLSNLLARDAFVDPINQGRVWAIASPVGAASGATGVYRSDDSGMTFGPSLFDYKLSGGLLSIESARSDPDVVYVASFENRVCAGGDGGDAGDGDGDADGDAGAPMLCPVPRLMRSGDAGANWDDPLDLEPDLGQGMIRIIAIDPDQPRRVFLRFQPADASGDRLLISDDAGATIREAVRVKGQLTAFLRRADGTILVAGMNANAPEGFRSPDDGATFVPWNEAPTLRALAERDGRIYGAADFIKDGFAIGVSTDGGATFSPLMNFSQVHGIRPCVKEACLTTCEFNAGIMLWPPETCDPPPAGKTGCGCVAGREGATLGGLLVAAVMSLAVFARRARRRAGS